MPLLSEGTRYMIDTLASRINLVEFGFSGQTASQTDDGIGQIAGSVVPDVRVIDDHTLVVEAKLPLATTFTQPLKEVVVRYKNPSDSSDTTDLFRYTFDAVTKTTNNEIRFSVVIEVSA
tara:strand:+ start:482 stop:838 length:357 start_codon:yes stop_codon:yes gene_type:complete